MSLMLISRFGATTSSFISASKSVPPARISLLPQVAPSRLKAWASTVRADILKRSHHAPPFCSSAASTRSGVRGRNGTRTPIALATAFEIACAGRDHGRLTQSDHAAFVITFARHHVDDQLGNIAQAGKPVELHIRIQHDGPWRRP